MRPEVFLDTPLIYNLFPLLAGPFTQWDHHLARAASLGFNWLYVNPVNAPGLSGSLYSTKDYYKLNACLSPTGSTENPLSDLVPIIRSMSEYGLHPMVDLVINHTSIDCPLVYEYPEWYLKDANGCIQHPFAVDPENPNERTVWRDLAEIDNRSSSDRDGLWEYWAKLVDTYLEMGFEGFRCDAAYQVPVELWQFLIERVRSVQPHVVFWAENLGCTVEQTRALREAGFQLFCNSSKWWNFRDSWCLDQHEEFRDLRSISFPETHDTERVSQEYGGNEAIQRQRYAFAAVFSTGLMIPIGYEFGFQKRLHVVQTRATDWETPRYDLSAFIQAVNHFKAETPLFQGDGKLVRIPVPSSDLLILERTSDTAPGKRAFIVVNSHDSATQCLEKHFMPSNAQGMRIQYLSWIDRKMPAANFQDDLSLDPSEVIVLLDNA